MNRQVFSRLWVALLIALFMLGTAWAGPDIHEAARRGNTPEVKAILDAYPDLENSRLDYAGETPLHAAASFEHKDVVELLIARGADVNASDDDGNTPLFRYLVDRPVVELLIARGADADARDDDGKTPLDHAIEAENGHVVRLLKKHGAK